MSKAISSALTASAVASTTAGLDALTTITLRLPVLFGEPAAAAVEWQRAWSEKVTAAMTGSLQAGFELQRMGLRMATGVFRADHLPHDLLRLAEAATDPGYKAVAANARRLRRKRRRTAG